MNFVSPNLDDIEIYNKFFGLDDNMSYENTITTLFLWDYMVNYKIYYEEDFLILGFYDNCFYLPFGNFEKGMKAIVSYAKNNNITPYFIASDCEKLNKFKNMFEGKFTAREVRDNFEYIYFSEDLANLSGKKYHSKRNHIKNFSKENNYVFESLNDENCEEILLAANAWYEENEKTESTKTELLGIKKILQNKDALNLMGGTIRVDGKIVAFTLASKVNKDTVNIHIEKALPDFKGAYPVINQEFAKILALKYKYINREDDIGIEGLRKAKLSYKPHILLRKYEINFNE